MVILMVCNLLHFEQVTKELIFIMMYINTIHLTLQDVASFTLKNNTSKQFKEKWGEEYVSRAMSLWRGVKECYS